MGKSLHLIDNAQHIYHSTIVEKKFFVIFKGKIIAFGTKMSKNRWQKSDRGIFLTSMFENLSKFV